MSKSLVWHETGGIGQRRSVKKFIVNFRLIDQDYLVPLDCDVILLVQTEGESLVIYYLGVEEISK
jgi:hypothetical protein